MSAEYTLPSSQAGDFRSGARWSEIRDECGGVDGACGCSGLRLMVWDACVCGSFAKPVDSLLTVAGSVWRPALSSSKASIRDKRWVTGSFSVGYSGRLALLSDRKQFSPRSRQLVQGSSPLPVRMSGKGDHPFKSEPLTFYFSLPTQVASHNTLPLGRHVMVCCECGGRGECRALAELAEMRRTYWDVVSQLRPSMLLIGFVSGAGTS